MRRVGVVTDSTACIPPDIAASLGIEVLPLVLAFGDKVYEDGTAEVAEFYETLRTTPHPPTTSAPPPAVYANAILRAGREARSRALRDGLKTVQRYVRRRGPGSGCSPDTNGLTWMCACSTLVPRRWHRGSSSLRRRAPLRTAAISTRSLSLAQQLMPTVQLVVMIDTLTYLARSGRVPRLVIWAAAPFKVRPIVAYEGGSYRPITIARTRPAGIERVFEELRRRARVAACTSASSTPTRRPTPRSLAERVRSELDPAELLTSEFTQVMGVHIGPGLVGFAFYTE